MEEFIRHLDHVIQVQEQPTEAQLKREKSEKKLGHRVQWFYGVGAGAVVDGAFLPSRLWYLHYRQTYTQLKLYPITT